MDKILTFEKGENLYDILGCPESASKEQIATEYRQKVRKCHPDKVQAGVSDISGNRETTIDEIADEKSKEYDRLKNVPFVYFESSFIDPFHVSGHCLSPPTFGNVEKDQ